MSTDPPTTLVPEVPPRQWSFLDDAVTRLIRERATLGAQVSVWTPSTGQHDLSWGTDHRLGQLPPAMLHSTFCVTKPVLAVGVLVALNQAGLGADVPIATVTPASVRVPVSVPAVSRTQRRHRLHHQRSPRRVRSCAHDGHR